MITKDQVLEEVQFRFGEWLEISGEQSPQILVQLLATMVAVEREKVENYKNMRDYAR